MGSGNKAKLRLLPAVHEVVADLSLREEIAANYSPAALTWAVRSVLQKTRQRILCPETSPEIGGSQPETAEEIRVWVAGQALQELQSLSSSLKRVINATGVILHTNCGRALLAPEVADYLAEQAKHYNNLELDLETGQRGSRYDHIQDLFRELTGAESSLVVNNNAAAVLLIMNTFALQREVIISRGELVEIGGSFRIPEVLAAGGAKLREVGTTNKTWLQDYREAVNENTALVLKVHTSNFRIEGFHHSVPTGELVKLGEEFGIPVVEDLGSGSLLDGTKFGLPKEPTIQEAVQEGVSLVCFSGDKLLGGPQAGIIVGKRELIEKLKTNQLTRALRVDKLTLAALAGTLRLYQRGEAWKIPVWGMLMKTKSKLREEASVLQNTLKDLKSLNIQLEDNYSQVGGGAFPTAKLPTVVCALQPLNGSVTQLEDFLRKGEIPILTRISRDKILFDPRTLVADDFQIIVERLKEWDKIQA
ncbi:MAG TPA: L-seryl-tRNA(Sec) selenium transferase [Peptococcaceae bacterium]|nr:L-seryl-tRNA(Sec) selenium transferase [Peptococcaceae bacterium]